MVSFDLCGRGTRETDPAERGSWLLPCRPWRRPRSSDSECQLFVAWVGTMTVANKGCRSANLHAVFRRHEWAMSQLLKVAGPTGEPPASVLLVHGLGGHHYEYMAVQHRSQAMETRTTTFWPLWLGA